MNGRVGVSPGKGSRLQQNAGVTKTVTPLIAHTCSSNEPFYREVEHPQLQ